MDELQTKIITMEAKLHALMNKCNGEIDNQFKKQIDNRNEMINQEIQKKIQQSASKIEKQLLSTLSQANEGRVTQFLKDSETKMSTPTEPLEINGMRLLND